MENITIPVDISPEIMLALNESEHELKVHFQAGIAMLLYQEGKLTFGKATQLSGLSRYEFEKLLYKNKVTIPNQGIEQVKSDVEKLSKF
jgi:predicted HTH domain antitoxin